MSVKGKSIEAGSEERQSRGPSVEASITQKRTGNDELLSTGSEIGEKQSNYSTQEFREGWLPAYVNAEEAEKVGDESEVGSGGAEKVVSIERHEGDYQSGPGTGPNCSGILPQKDLGLAQKQGEIAQGERRTLGLEHIAEDQESNMDVSQETGPAGDYDEANKEGPKK